LLGISDIRRERIQPRRNERCGTGEPNDCHELQNA
jgi:hypothetical protein